MPADVFSKETRSRVMRAIPATGTTPELVVRAFLRRLRIKFRGNVGSLPGSPDIVIGSAKTVIFVNSCFWHGHNCRHGRTKPRTNERFWRHKIERNKARDRRSKRLLRTMGWRVLTVWECELGAGKPGLRRLQRLLSK